MAMWQRAKADRYKALAERIARLTTHGATPGVRSDPAVGAVRQIVGSASRKFRRWAMSELIPREDVPEDEAALLDYLIQIVEQGRHTA
jgi:hypothetical protein